VSAGSTQATLLVVSAPSGAGKTSLVKALLESETDVVLSVSHTTRAPRAGEIEGVDYHFVDRKKFAAMCSASQFLEHAEVFGNRYGTSGQQVDAHLQRGTDVILDVDWQGARQIREHMPGSVSVFILPPSWMILEQRLRGRRTDSSEVIEKRMRAAQGEVSHFSEFDFLLVNEDLPRAVEALRLIVRANRLKLAPQRARHDGLIRELLAESTTNE
jgi:guanylate kinase